MSHQLSRHDLAELKRQIDQQTLPLIPHLKTPYDRFSAYMSILRDNWSTELFHKAHEEAQKIEDPADKVYSLQSLSNEVQYRMQELPDAKAEDHSVQHAE